MHRARAPHRRRARRAPRRSPRGRAASSRAAPGVWKCCFDPRPQLAAPLLPQRLRRPARASRCRSPRRCATWKSRSAASRRSKSSPCARMRSMVSRSAAMLGFANAARGERRDLALDQPARGEELERARAFVATVRGPSAPCAAAASSAGRAHEDAGADAHFDAAGDFERDDRLAHRRARHAEQHGELALRREAASRRQIRRLSISAAIWPAICRYSRSVRRPATARELLRDEAAPVSLAGSAPRIAPLRRALMGRALYAARRTRSSGPTTGP